MGTYFALELKRALRDPSALMFTIGIPAFMYYIFGVSMEWGAYDIGNGNVSMYVMINMAAYGAVTATTSVGGLAAVERMQGWGRQLGLTPMPDSRFVVTKALVGTAVAALPIALIYLIGYFTDAQAIWWVWPASAGLVLLGAMLFSLYGLMVGFLFRSENAVGIASGMVVIFGFLGNVFMPLSGAMLTFSKFTPLYGLAALARRPLTEGNDIDQTTGELIVQPLWQILANVGGWLLIFGVAAIVLVRRSRERQ